MTNHIARHRMEALFSGQGAELLKSSPGIGIKEKMFTLHAHTIALRRAELLVLCCRAALALELLLEEAIHTV